MLIQGLLKIHQKLIDKNSPKMFSLERWKSAQISLILVDIDKHWKTTTYFATIGFDTAENEQSNCFFKYWQLFVTVVKLCRTDPPAGRWPLQNLPLRKPCSSGGELLSEKLYKARAGTRFEAVRAHIQYRERNDPNPRLAIPTPMLKKYEKIELYMV